METNANIYNLYDSNYLIEQICRVVRCDECKKTFYKQNNLNEHVAAVHKGRKYQCPADGCRKLYTSAYRFKHHYREIHSLPVPDSRSVIVYDSERGLVPGEEAKNSLILELRDQIRLQKRQITTQKAVIDGLRRKELKK